MVGVGGSSPLVSTKLTNKICYAEKMIEIFKAKSVITVNPSMPRAEAIAVKDGLILEAGTIETLQPWLVDNDYSINDQFKDSIIVPGQ